MRTLIAFSLAALCTVGSHTANAAVLTFTDRALWEAALPAAVSSFEDFQSFGADAVFRTSAVNASGFSLQQTGTDQAFRNFVDVPAFDFSDNNGTAHASMFVEADFGPTGVLLTAFSSVIAFGADFTGTGSGERVDIVISGSQLFSPLNVPDYASTPGTSGFFGFILTDGDFATALQFQARNVSIGAGGEGFSMDNVALLNAGQAVPEPSSVALVAFGVLAIAAMRRR